MQGFWCLCVEVGWPDMRLIDWLDSVEEASQVIKRNQVLLEVVKAGECFLDVEVSQDLALITGRCQEIAPIDHTVCVKVAFVKELLQVLLLTSKGNVFQKLLRCRRICHWC